MGKYQITTPSGVFEVETADIGSTENPMEQKNIAGPIGRGFDALQKGITAADIPHVAAKTVSGLAYGIPELLQDKYIAGPIQTMSPSPSFFPKPATEEGKRLGEDMGMAAGFVPGIEVLQKILAPAGKVAAAKGANRLMTSVLKPNIKQLQKEPQLGLKAAKMGLSGSKQRIAEKAEKMIVENEAKIDGIIKNSKGTVDATKIADGLNDLKRPFANTGDDASVSAIEKLQATLKSKGTLSVQDAQQLKKDFYSGLKPTAYGQGTGKLGASIQGEKAAARGLKEGIEAAEPTKPIGEINKKTGVAGMTRDAVERQDLMDQRKNMASGVDTLLMAGSLLNPKMLAILAAKKAAGSDIVKSKLAELLAKFA